MQFYCQHLAAFRDNTDNSKYIFISCWVVPIYGRYSTLSQLHNHLFIGYCIKYLNDRTRFKKNSKVH